MSSLRILAGPRALATLQQHGFTQRLFDTIIGASGGPKWFVLFGLDKFLLSEFFQGRQEPIQLLGSSAGAWRFGCYAQQNGVEAISRFCHAYRCLDYPRTSTRAQVTAISAEVLRAIFPTPQHAQQCLEHPFFRLNFVIARGKGLLNSAHPTRVVTGLVGAATANLVHRRHLGRFVERVVCHHPTQPYAHVPQDLPTRQLALTNENISAALFASGAIPMVLEPVSDIADAPAGYYMDGGITDYHFAWPMRSEKLVLYPHFSSKVSPGWFDKNLTRAPAAGDFDNVVMLVPADSWVQSLPGGKIPDRNDFKTLSAQERLARWQIVTERSSELADDLRRGNYQFEPLTF